MTEEKNQIEKTQTIVELQVIPSNNRIAANTQHCKTQNHENQDDPCGSKIILTVASNGAILAKADAGYNAELTQEIWVTAKMTKADSGKISDIDVNVHERCGSKLTKADSGKI